MVNIEKSEIVINNHIQFGDIFDLEDIQHLQDLFSDANCVASIITTPDGKPITKPSNFTRLCSNIIRNTEKGCSNCYKSDAILGHPNPSGPIVQTCLSGGLWDAGASIIAGGEHIANWLIGQVRNEELDEQQMLSYADEIGANRIEFVEALNEVPIMSVEQFKKIAKMLFAFSRELSEKAYKNLELKTEIAERKKATKLLQNSEERFRVLFEGAPDAILLADPITGKILDANQAACQLLLRDRQEIIKMHQNELHPPQKLAYTKEQFDQHIKDSQYKGFTQPVENTVLRSDGSEVPVEVLAQIIQLGDQQVLLGTFRDIRERKKVDRVLQEREERHRTILHAAMDGFWLTDLNGYLLEVNESYCKMSGYSKQELLNMQIKDVVIEESATEIVKRIDRIKQNGSERFYSRHCCMDGKKIDVEVSVQYLKTEKENLITFLRDITEQKKADEGIKFLLAEKELILKEVHHRIKNNMNTIYGLLVLQSQSIQDPSVKDALLDAGSRVKSMQLLYEKLYQTTDYAELSLSEYLNPLITEILSNFQNKEIVKIEYSIDDITLSATQLQPLGIIINELITNIMKYAFVGKADGIITVSTTLKENLVTLSIADNGNGMPESVDFENSTGFGLVLVNGLTQKLGGTIRIERGQGTKIVLEFEK